MAFYDSLDSELTGSDIFSGLGDPWSDDDEGGLPSTLSTGGLEYAPVDDISGWLSAGYTIDEIAAAGWDVAGWMGRTDDDVSR